MRPILKMNAQTQFDAYAVGSTARGFVLLNVHDNTRSSSKRLPVHVSLVIDRSGSMSGAPLETVRQAASFLVNQLKEVDRFSLVVFDDEIQTLISSVPVKDKLEIQSAIEQIFSGGMTNLFGGLVEGCENIVKAETGNFVQRVILLSDGQANVGITDPEIIAEKVREYQQKQLTISTIGVSDDFNEELMESIAQNGTGNYTFIRDLDDIPNVFQKELTELLEVTAQGVELELQAVSHAKIIGIYGGAVKKTQTGWRIRLGDLQENDHRPVLIEFETSIDGVGPRPIAEATLTYKNARKKLQEERNKLTLYAKGTVFSEECKLLDSEVEKHVLRIQNAKAVEKVIQLFDEKAIEEATYMLKSQSELLLKEAERLSDDQLREEALKLQEKLIVSNNPARFRKDLHEVKYMNERRR